VTKPPSYSPQTLPRRFAGVAERLDGVQIEALDAGKLISQYDRPTTFFYCDPPYVGVDLYQHNFTDDQFEQLAQRLGSISGRFLLSINDCPKAREWFKGFKHREISFTYTSTRHPNSFPELLFANYPLRQAPHAHLDTPPISEDVDALKPVLQRNDHVV
jgi:DNA adenine methylase